MGEWIRKRSENERKAENRTNVAENNLQFTMRFYPFDNLCYTFPNQHFWMHSCRLLFATFVSFSAVHFIIIFSKILCGYARVYTMQWVHSASIWVHVNEIEKHLKGNNKSKSRHYVCLWVGEREKFLYRLVRLLQLLLTNCKNKSNLSFLQRSHLSFSDLICTLGLTVC